MKDDILEAALQAYTTKPAQNVTVDEIAKLAGVSKGVIFYYFKNKDNLERETLIYSIKKYLGEGINSIADFIDVSLKIIAETPSLVRFWQYVYEKEVYSRDPSFVQNSFKEIINEVAFLLKSEGVKNPEKTAIILMAMLDGLAIYSTFLDLGRVEDFESIISEFIDCRRVRR